MKYPKKILTYFICAMLITLATCSLSSIIGSTPVAVASTIKINKTKATITVGKTIKLKVIGTSKKITWSSSNKSIAKVTTNGTVTGKKAGKATITAKVKNKKYKCIISVKNPYKIEPETNQALIKQFLSTSKGKNYKKFFNTPEGKSFQSISYHFAKAFYSGDTAYLEKNLLASVSKEDKKLMLEEVRDGLTEDIIIRQFRIFKYNKKKQTISAEYIVSAKDFDRWGTLSYFDFDLKLVKGKWKLINFGADC